MPCRLDTELSYTNVSLLHGYKVTYSEKTHRRVAKEFDSKKWSEEEGRDTTSPGNISVEKDNVERLSRWRYLTGTTVHELILPRRRSQKMPNILVKITISVEIDQCDKIWRNFATLAKVY